jgi:prepilin-type N-terminal cleavage/methylation domain-containing protein
MRERCRFQAHAELPIRAGFTLIEMAIVLVIIGLIVGAVVAGQSLIYAATLRSVISQQLQIQTAIATFRGKYNCLPGDCANASAFGFTGGDPGQVQNNGNGDGIIGPPNGYLFSQPAADEPAPNNEPVAFWAHLSQAGLISGYKFSGWGPGTPAVTALQPYGIAFPSKIRSCAWYVGYSASATTLGTGGSYLAPPNLTGLGNVLALVGPNTQCAFITCGGSMFSECLTPQEAQDIDTKADDGMPWTGNVRGASGGNYIDNPPYSNAAGWVMPPNQCAVTPTLTSTYGPPKTDYLDRCNLLFRISTEP